MLNLENGMIRKLCESLLSLFMPGRHCKSSKISLTEIVKSYLSNTELDFLLRLKRWSAHGIMMLVVETGSTLLGQLVQGKS